MQLKFISLMVSDQAHALDFYTRVLGFEKRADIARLAARGVTFRGTPTRMGPITAVTFEDTCSNLINLVQTHE